jgi:hypothetical protein
MIMIRPIYPPFAKGRGLGYWLRWTNIWASRRKFRSDNSNVWRYAFHGSNLPTEDRSRPFAELVDRPIGNGFRFVIIGDTGEGDRSQYGLVPLLRAVNPDFMIINGDVAYPAGRNGDFISGFFEPYRGFGIPIWAVPGNHEYYSPHHGREFFEIFCTSARATDWDSYGLRLVPQPGMYWELRDPDRKTDLVVIGIDSGKKAILDKKGRKHEDGRQHCWLEWRLQLADDAGDKVIVLFHIPGLVREKHNEKTRLSVLHRVIARHPSVRLVVCAHEHNHQDYDGSVFGRYLVEKHGAVEPSNPPPYIVSGHGGAYLGGTDFKPGPYTSRTRFPTPEDWRNFAWVARRVLDRHGMSKYLLSRIVGMFEKATLSDADAAKLLSFLLVEVRPRQATVVHPVFMRDLQLLFPHLPDGTTVNVVASDPNLDPEAVKNCFQQSITL